MRLTVFVGLIATVASSGYDGQPPPVSQQAQLMKEIPMALHNHLAGMGLMIQPMGFLSTAGESTHCIPLSISLGAFIDELIPDCSQAKRVGNNLSSTDTYCHNKDIQRAVNESVAEARELLMEGLRFETRSVNALAHALSQLKTNAKSPVAGHKRRRKRFVGAIAALVVGGYGAVMGTAAMGFATANRLELQRLDREQQKLKHDVKTLMADANERFLAIEKSLHLAHQRLNDHADRIETLEYQRKFDGYLHLKITELLGGVASAVKSLRLEPSLVDPNQLYPILRESMDMQNLAKDHTFDQNKDILFSMGQLLPTKLDVNSQHLEGIYCVPKVTKRNMFLVGKPFGRGHFSGDMRVYLEPEMSPSVLVGLEELEKIQAMSSKPPNPTFFYQRPWQCSRSVGLLQLCSDRVLSKAPLEETNCPIPPTKHCSFKPYPAGPGFYKEHLILTGHLIATTEKRYTQVKSSGEVLIRNVQNPVQTYFIPKGDRFIFGQHTALGMLETEAPQIHLADIPLSISSSDTERILRGEVTHIEARINSTGQKMEHDLGLFTKSMGTEGFLGEWGQAIPLFIFMVVTSAIVWLLIIGAIIYYSIKCCCRKVGENIGKGIVKSASKNDSARLNSHHAYAMSLPY